MTFTEFLISSFLSLTAALGIYIIIDSLKERKWTNLLLITLVIIIILFLLLYPSSSDFLNKTPINKYGIPLLAFFLLLFIVFWVIAYLNKPLGKLQKLKSYIVDVDNHDIRKKNVFWQYFNIEEEKAKKKDITHNRSLEITDKYFINNKYLYQLLMPSGYNHYDLTFIDPFNNPNNQIGVVHMIHQEKYISWIDVMYWRILKKLSEHNISVYVFVSDIVASNNTFLTYLKRFLGNKVIIDDSLFKSLKSLETENNDKPTCKRIASREPNYNRLRYFSQLSPILLSKKHTFILMWEGYYTNYSFFETINRDTDNSIEIKSDISEFPISLNLSNYKSEFLIAPTCFALDDKGKKYAIIPADSFLLGQNDYKDTLKKIKGLNNYTLRSISSQVLCSTLPWFERIFFNLVLNLLICARSDRKENENNQQIWPTKIIAKIFVFMSSFIHNRIVKDARL